MTPPQDNYRGHWSDPAFDTNEDARRYKFAEGTRGQYNNFGLGQDVRLHGEEMVKTKSEGLSEAAQTAALRTELQGLRADFTREIRGLGPSADRSLTAALLTSASDDDYSHGRNADTPRRPSAMLRLRSLVRLDDWRAAVFYRAPTRAAASV